MNYCHITPQNMNLLNTSQCLFERSSIINDNDHCTRLPSTPPHLRISSPKTPPTVIRRIFPVSSMSFVTSSSALENDENKLQPLTTYRLKPITQKVRSMVMTLTESGLVCLEFIKVRNGIERIVEMFSVSQDGNEIIITYPRHRSYLTNDDSNNRTTKTFSLINLPERYHKKYEHARKFVTLIQSKTPKVTLYNQQAKCMLMENFPNPNFEAQFYSGRKIIINWSGMKLVDDKDGSILSLSSPRIQQQLNNEVQQMITFSGKCQEQCLQFEALVKSTANHNCERDELFPVIIGKRPVSQFEALTSNISEIHPVNISTVTSSSSSSDSTDTGSSVIRQTRVSKIGLASELDNGDIWVEFEDGCHLGIKPTVTTVTYIDQVGLLKKYRKSEPLPENVKTKLALVPIVLEQLMTSQKSEAISHLT